MKKLLLLFSIVLFSCSGDDSSNQPVNTDGNIGLLKRMVETFDDGTTKTVDFKYQNGNQLLKMETSAGPTIKFFYQDGRIIKKEWLYSGETEPYESFFEYDANGRVSRFERGYLSIMTYLFSYSPNQVDYDLYNGPVIAPEFYQSSGTIPMVNENVTSDNQYTYTYDVHKSPYYGIAGLEKTYFINQSQEFDNYPVYSHNLAVKQDDEFGITYTYTYQYNADDKPVYQATSNLIITYEYY